MKNFITMQLGSHHYSSKNNKETRQVGEKFWKIINDRKRPNLVLLRGEVGGGKTTFCQGVLRAAGAEGPFTSPTFVLMKKYKVPPAPPESEGKKFFENIYHFDCYRVNAKDILDLDWEEILRKKKNLVLVEWPEKIEKIWPKKYWIVFFELVKKNSRKIKLFERPNPRIKSEDKRLLF